MRRRLKVNWLASAPPREIEEIDRSAEPVLVSVTHCGRLTVACGC
jgi:hypothetical protein